MSTRAKAALAAGFVLFLAGSAGAAYLGSRGSATPAAAQAKVEVLSSARPIAAGTAASTALADGSIRTKSVPAADRPADAVVDPSEISGRVAASAIPAGATLTTSMFPAPQTRIGTVIIPSGKRALSLELQPVPGVAGFVGGGDHVDIYAVAKSAASGPNVRLILQSVEVLSVNGAGLPSAQGQPGGPNLIYLLAVTPTEAERLIYLNEFEKLYFDLIPKGEAPVTTPGAGPGSAFQAL
ncbi:MAG: Flp pilus assembly protein CpaB [Acidimicrobiales bacterium]